jgi:hypothetical protein
LRNPRAAELGEPYRRIMAENAAAQEHFEAQENAYRQAACR